MEANYASRIHTILGYSGLIPFIGLSVLLISGWHEAHFLLVSYSALILCFLSGSIWMKSIMQKKHMTIAIASNVFMLSAWAALLIDDHLLSLIIMASLLALIHWFELWLFDLKSNQAYLRLRSTLSILAVISLIMAAVFV